MEALLKISLLIPGYFLLVFPGYITICKLKQFFINENEYIHINRSKYAQFFSALSSICVAIANDKKTDGLLLEADHSSYFWNWENKLLKIKIKLDGKESTSMTLSDLEFFHLLQCYKDALYSSLLVNETEHDVLCQLSRLPLKQLIEFEHNSTAISKILKIWKYEKQTLVNLTILVKSCLDCIIIVHKLSSLGDNTFMTSSLKLIVPPLNKLSDKELEPAQSTSIGQIEIVPLSAMDNNDV